MVVGWLNGSARVSLPKRGLGGIEAAGNRVWAGRGFEEAPVRRRARERENGRCCGLVETSGTQSIASINVKTGRRREEEAT